MPYPILLVLGGLAIGFVPGMPEIELPPSVVLVAVLPPLLYGAAFFTSLRELRANVEPIGLLAIGLVFATTVSVAVVAHAVVAGLPWAEAFALGAIVSPTDPIAATSVARRVGIPRRVVGVVEGESLINDGTALVAYRFAVTAAVTGTFSITAAGTELVTGVLGGVGIGLAVGYVVRQVRRRLDDPPAEIALSLCTGYFAFLPAEYFGFSAVLAAVTVGVYMGWHTPELTTPQVRLQGQAVWEIAAFVLNAVLFLAVGLQLPAILDGLSQMDGMTLLAYAAAIGATVVLTRLVWVFPATYLPRVVPRLRRAPAAPWQEVLVIGWSGMRGAVSLAAALALPTDVVQRELLVFLAFAVILVTLVGQGMTLPALIRALTLEEDGQAAREEAKARIKAAEAALGRLDELLSEGWVNDDTAERMAGLYRFRVSRFAERFDDGGDGSIEARSVAYQRLRRELLQAERDAVTGLRRSGTIDDEVMNRVLRDLDLEDLRLDV